jgi:hypothetical protein
MASSHNCDQRYGADNLNTAPARCEDSLSPKVQAFLDALAATAAKQLLLQLEGAESEAKEERA